MEIFCQEYNCIYFYFYSYFIFFFFLGFESCCPLTVFCVYDSLGKGSGFYTNPQFLTTFTALTLMDNSYFSSHLRYNDHTLSVIFFSGVDPLACRISLFLRFALAASSWQLPQNHNNGYHY